IITFDSVESATRAKETLHGADIYSGCCTLKIDFAKPRLLKRAEYQSTKYLYREAHKSQMQSISMHICMHPVEDL
ncbi:Heterogeneous nuclear ribonucleoprotein L, partial [Trachymyrmex zeteki]